MTLGTHSLGCRFHSTLAVVLMSVITTLAGCGGGGGGNSTPPPPPIMASPGYFDNVSTLGGAKVFSDTANTIPLDIADLQGMVNGNKFTLVSVANNLAYYATFTSLSGNTYTANVAIYQDNIPYGNTTVSGTLVAGTSISGTFATTGTGLGKGTFKLDYSLANTPVAAVSRVVRDATSIAWVNNANTARSSAFQVDSTGAVSNSNLLSPKTGIFIGCVVNGSIAAIPNTALYQINMTLTNCGSTATSLVNGTYVGLATSRKEIQNDDRLVVTVTSGLYSMDGEFH